MMVVNLSDLISIFDAVFPKFFLGTKKKVYNGYLFYNSLNICIHLKYVYQMKEKLNTM